MIYQYVCKFYLNASHFIYINDKPGAPHSHCFEFVLDIGTKNKENFISFTEIETLVEDILQPYQEQLINEISPFNEINPTLENMATYFERVFLAQLVVHDWLLITLELSETPTRSYLINVVEDLITEPSKKRLTEVDAVEPLLELENCITIPELVNKDVEDETQEDISTNETELGFVELIDDKNFVEVTDGVSEDKVKLHIYKNSDETEFEYHVPNTLLHFDI